jgi:uncharacterized protein (DUF1697 family)
VGEREKKKLLRIIDKTVLEKFRQNISRFFLTLKAILKPKFMHNVTKRNFKTVKQIKTLKYKPSKALFAFLQISA